jgi:hypothetical protein
VILSYSLNGRQTEIIFELSAMQWNIGLLVSNYLNEYERHFNKNPLKHRLTEQKTPLWGKNKPYFNEIFPFFRSRKISLKLTLCFTPFQSVLVRLVKGLLFANINPA